MELPLISVITPSFNQGQYIKETIESVLNQGYPNLEYWVVDGGSTDNTIEILKEYQDDRLHFISEPDKGQSDALQKGFDRCKGEIVGWINSDDILKPSCLFAVAEAFKQSEDIGLVYGDVEIIDSDGKHIKSFKPLPLTYEGLKNDPKLVIVQPGSFYRKCYFNRAGGIDPALKYVMDYDLFHRLLKISKGLYIPRLLAEFRLHPTSKTYEYTGSKFIVEAFKVSYRYNPNLFTRINFYRVKSLCKGMIKRLLGLPYINLNKLKD